MVETCSRQLTEGLIAGMPFMPENEISRETGKYVISLDNAKAARINSSTSRAVVHVHLQNKYSCVQDSSKKSGY